MTVTKEQFDQFISTLRLIAHGGTEPAGLEGIGIALAGSDLVAPIGPALTELAQAVERHAQAVTDAAETIAQAIDANLDNGECLRAFRDACRAYTNSKELDELARSG